MDKDDCDAMDFLRDDLAYLDAKCCRLAARVAEIEEHLQIIVNNAFIINDPSMGSTCDIYAVPLDDIDKARALLAGKKEGER